MSGEKHVEVHGFCLTSPAGDRRYGMYVTNFRLLKFEKNIFIGDQKTLFGMRSRT